MLSFLRTVLVDESARSNIDWWWPRPPADQKEQEQINRRTM